MDFTAIFIVGFLVWGTYKLFELYARRKERLMIIEKLIEHTVSSKDEPMKLPSLEIINLRGNDSWALKFALLLMGFGLGAICAFFTTQCINVYNNRHDAEIVYFAFIALFGGLGLLISYLIESKNSKK